MNTQIKVLIIIIQFKHIKRTNSNTTNFWRKWWQRNTLKRKRESEKSRYREIVKRNKWNFYQMFGNALAPCAVRRWIIMNDIDSNDLQRMKKIIYNLLYISAWAIFFLALDLLSWQLLVLKFNQMESYQKKIVLTKSSSF